ncbi:MAG TPA: Cof-type HAD-IIB family hydrolase [Negativicutes bacterium]|nr:Cof-type HAD-IIB family hydrolase [Negativicutes bacterium]
MTIKLVAIDMDDTLLDNSQQVTERTRQAIRRAMDAGVAVAIATGRMFRSALPFAQELGIQLPLITYNGAMIRELDSGKTLFHRPIEKELAQELADLFRQRGWYLQKYVDDRLYVAELDENAKFYADYARVEAIPLGDEFFQMAEAPTKMLSMGDTDELNEIRTEVAARYGDRLYLASSKKRYLEMVDVRVNKGEALAFLAERLGIAQNEIMAIGDSMNDVDMIAYAGCGVAMGNANATVRAAADFITATNSEDGVAAAIEKFALV